MTDGQARSLDHLRQLGEELRAMFAAERHAISTLDHAQLERIAAMKQDLADRLAEARAAAPDSTSPQLRDLFAAIRVEAHATALLARAATDAVRAMLGYEATGAYDSRAKRVTTTPLRILTAF